MTTEKFQSAEAWVEEYLIKEILNEHLKAGEFLKPQRDLAKELGYSRPVIHKALIRLEGRGLVTIYPRQGVKVNDYRIEGKLGLLESIYSLNRFGIQASLNQHMLTFVRDHFGLILKTIMSFPEEKREKLYQNQTHHSPRCGSEMFQWIHSYAIFSENPIYPMLINEFKVGIINVGDIVLKKSEILFLEDRQAIDLMVCNGETEKVDEALVQWFKKIERYWLEEENHVCL